ncbi:MAG: PEP-utilizing enzyme [Candidatus Aenigmatarchaeota archaeon]
MKKNKKNILLKGIPASNGIVKGKVSIILNPSMNSKMKRGNILVTHSTNPLFTPAILKAKGIITEKGGILCHAAIIARELDIPCLVSVEKATQILRDNQEIILDGNKGIIYHAK